MALFMMEYHWKNLLATWGLEPALLMSVNRNARPSAITHPANMDASSHESFFVGYMMV